MQKILIVEDEPSLVELLADYINSAGYESNIMMEGTGVVESVKNNTPDLILLDIMLPGMNGMDICKAIRKFSQVPIIMVTARVEEIDRLLGLEFGADDYICKPYSPREVVARVKAVLRRSQASSAQELTKQHGLDINEDTFIAKIQNAVIDLTPSEFRLLNALSKTPGRVYSRDQLQSFLYTDKRIVTDRTIDTHVKNLRRKIEAANNGVNLVHSVYGVGYKFELL